MDLAWKFLPFNLLVFVLKGLKSKLHLTKGYGVKRLQPLMRKGILLGILASASSAQSADEFEYHGYFRAGIGASEGGTDQVCYQLPRAGGNYFRLGNECGTYGEVEFTKIFGDKNGTKPWFSASVLYAFSSATDESYEAVGSDSNLWLANVYMEGHGLIGGEGKVWVGKRFYHRRGIHMLDLWYVDAQGPGAGAYDIKAGPGKLGLALFRRQGESTPVQTTADVRYQLDVGGDFEAIAMSTGTGKRDGKTGDHNFETLTGNSLTLIHKLNKKGFSNHFAFQYGTGLFGSHPTRPEGTTINNYNNSNTVARGDTAARDIVEESSSMRIIDEVMLEGEKYAATFIALYTSSDFGGALDSDGNKVKNRTVTSLGVRPYYFLSDTQALAVELGTTTYTNPWLSDLGKASTGDWNVTHATLAYNLRMETGYYARPEFRFFASHRPTS